MFVNEEEKNLTAISQVGVHPSKPLTQDGWKANLHKTDGRQTLSVESDPSPPSSMGRSSVESASIWKPAMEATASLSSHAASAASAASTSRPRARPSRSRGIFVSAAGRRSCPLQLPRRCRPPQPSPPPSAAAPVRAVRPSRCSSRRPPSAAAPCPRPSDAAAAAAVGRRPQQPSAVATFFFPP